MPQVFPVLIIAWAYHVISKETEKYKNCSFKKLVQLFSHIDTHVLKDHVGKMVELLFLEAGNIAI